MLSTVWAGACSVLTAAPQSAYNDHSNFTDPETQTLRGRVRHFPKSCSQMMAGPGAWNQLCPISRLVLFFTTGIFFILSLLHCQVLLFPDSDFGCFSLYWSTRIFFSRSILGVGVGGCEVLYSLGVEAQRCPPLAPRHPFHPRSLYSPRFVPSKTVIPVLPPSLQIPALLDSQRELVVSQVLPCM